MVERNENRDERKIMRGGKDERNLPTQQRNTQKFQIHL